MEKHYKVEGNWLTTPSMAQAWTQRMKRGLCEVPPEVVRNYERLTWIACQGKIGK